MRYLLLIFVFVLFTHRSLEAQEKGIKNMEAEKNHVIEVVNKLFDGMHQGDSAMVSSAFTREAEMYTALRDKNGAPVLIKGSLDKFLKAVGTPHEKVWEEPIWDTEVKIDQDLAQVWTKYAFYVGNQFSHCGVDAFLLHKGKAGWKIFHITDTRQWQGCEVPGHIKKGQ